MRKKLIGFLTVAVCLFWAGDCWAQLLHRGGGGGLLRSRSQYNSRSSSQYNNVSSQRVFIKQDVQVPVTRFESRVREVQVPVTRLETRQITEQVPVTTVETQQQKVFVQQQKAVKEVRQEKVRQRSRLRARSYGGGC